MIVPHAPQIRRLLEYVGMPLLLLFLWDGAIVLLYKVAHWDLTGPLYLPLHEYFQQQADFYLQQADVFAERVLHLGASVDSRFSTIASTTKLAELPDGYLTDDHALKLLLDRVTVLQKEVYRLIGETEGGGGPQYEGM